MARPVKWSRDLHPIRDRAAHSRTETWSRQDIERLFDVGRASAQSLMKAIGEVQAVAGAHFVGRTSLLSFLDEMISADSVDNALRSRLLEADAPPAPRPLRVALPADLRSVMLRDLPDTIRLSPGRLEIAAPTPFRPLRHRPVTPIQWRDGRNTSRRRKRNACHRRITLKKHPQNHAGQRSARTD